MSSPRWPSPLAPLCGEVIARGEGEGSRGEVVASSLFSAVVVAALTLLIVLLYRGA